MATQHARKGTHALKLTIVGDGIVGSSLVLGLAQAGVPVTWVRKPVALPDATRQLQVSAINHGSQALFERLSVWSVIHAHAHAYTDMYVQTRTDNPLHFSTTDVGKGNIGHIIANADMRDALHTAIAEQTQLISVVDCKEACVFNPEKPGELQVDGKTIPADLLIAADGKRSAIREQAGFTSQRLNYHQKAIVIAANATTSLADQAWQTFLPSGPLAWLPRGGKSGVLVWSLPETTAEHYRQNSNERETELVKHLARTFTGLQLGEQCLAFPLTSHHTTCYHRGGIVLVGDAAHSIHPLAGMGLNLGLADIAELLPTLVALWQRGHRDERLLKRYERQRRWHNESTRQLMTWINNHHSDNSALGRLAWGAMGRSRLLRAFAIQAALEKKATAYAMRIRLSSGAL